MQAAEIIRAPSITTVVFRKNLIGLSSSSRDLYERSFRKSVAQPGHEDCAK